MKEKIKEVQNYFADKIARGLYTISEVREHTMDIEVDKNYKFCIWIGNGLEYIGTHNGYQNFMELHFSQKQKAAISRRIKKRLDSEVKEREVKQLKALIAKHPEVINSNSF